jgi:transcriptional regulator with XRE-family HTH domain
MRQVAELAGVSYVTVRQWKSGRRVPDRESRQRLARALRQHSDRLSHLAEELLALEEEAE